MHESYRVSIEVLENGFKVEVPDMEAMAEKKAAAAKAKQPMPYMGDCTKSFAAQSVAEVLKIVKTGLSKLPEKEYDAAFNDAAKAKEDDDE